MSITTETTTTRRHRATLAGGITVTIEPTVFGYVLTIADELRGLALTLLPKQVEEMATWEAVPSHYTSTIYNAEPCIESARTWTDCADFVYGHRLSLGESHATACTYSTDDIATLRSLAVAVLAQEAQS